jgi:hypothetical protein
VTQSAETDTLYFELSGLRGIPMHRWHVIEITLKRLAQVCDAWCTTSGRLIVTLDLGALEGRKRQMAKSLLESKILQKVNHEAELHKQLPVS